MFNPFPNRQIWDRSKFKEASDDNRNVVIKEFLVTYCIKKNIVEKGEIAQNEQFHLFPQCFPIAFFFNTLN